jgi:hypothetical protein
MKNKYPARVSKWAQFDDEQLHLLFARVMAVPPFGQTATRGFPRAQIEAMLDQKNPLRGY